MAIARQFPWAGYRTYVDVGTAQGDLAAQIALANPHLTGQGFDLPEVGPIFTEYVAGLGLSGRLTFAAGSFFTDPLPKADVVLMDRAIFPGTVLDKKAEDWLTTTTGGYRYATAVGSDITGFRPTEIIVDDPIEPEKGSSELAKEKIRSWISSSVLTRFEDNAKNVFILVMHRVAPDDLAGTLQMQDGYFTLSLLLVAEQEEAFCCVARRRHHDASAW